MLASMSADAAGVKAADFTSVDEVLKAAKQQGAADLGQIVPYLQAQRQVEAWQRGELSPDEVQVMMTDPTIREAMRRVGIERGVPVLSSFLSGVRLKPVAAGERTQVAEQRAERAAGYKPLTRPQGSRADVEAIRAANPFGRTRWAQYGSLPGEETGGAIDILASTMRDIGRSEVNQRYDKLETDLLRSAPADHRQLRDLENARFSELADVVAKFPRQPGTPGLWSMMGANPQEYFDRRQQQILYELSRSKPDPEDYLTPEGKTDWATYFMARQMWQANLPLLARTNPTIAAALADLGPAGKGMSAEDVFAQMTSPDAMDAYSRRFHGPIRALHEVVYQKYQDAWQAYNDAVEAGTPKGEAFKATVGALQGGRATDYIDDVMAAYADRGWSRDDLAKVYAGINDIPAGADIYTLNMPPTERELKQSESDYFNFIAQNVPPGNEDWVRRAFFDAAGNPRRGLPKEMAAIQGWLYNPDGSFRQDRTLAQYQAIMRWMTANVPGNLKGDPEEWAAARAEAKAYRADVEQKFGSDIWQIQSDYFAAGPKGSKARKAFLKAHPQLKAYWDGRKKLAAKYPLYQKYYQSTSAESGYRKGGYSRYYSRRGRRSYRRSRRRRGGGYTPYRRPYRLPGYTPGATQRRKREYIGGRH